MTVFCLPLLLKKEKSTGIWGAQKGIFLEHIHFCKLFTDLYFLSTFFFPYDLKTNKKTPWMRTQDGIVEKTKMERHRRGVIGQMLTVQSPIIIISPQVKRCYQWLLSWKAVDLNFKQSQSFDETFMIYVKVWYLVLCEIASYMRT